MHPRLEPSTSSFAYLGSVGKAAITIPSPVIPPLAPIAPRLCSVIFARSTDSSGGFSKSFRFSIFNPRAASHKIIWLKSKREISGVLYLSKDISSFCLHNLTATPGDVLPARPALWVALAKLTRSTSKVFTPRAGSKRATLANPESMTYLTPSIVSDVSATFVETMTLRPELFERILSCARGSKSPCNAYTSKPFDIGEANMRDTVFEIS
ncbi:unknown [Coraliomargarita sp. CAG:312]|nr:unknown [Coraliomargarita sp. CAG:312]